MNDKDKKIILNDELLDARINCSKEEYEKILEKIITTYPDLKTELNKIAKEYEIYYDKYKALLNRSKKTKKIKKHIKDALEGKKVFGYGFFSDNNNRALYIGQTYKGLNRISQHLDGYSSVDRIYPLCWIDSIKIWYDDRISQHIKNLIILKKNTKDVDELCKYKNQINECLSGFESFLYHKFNPFFNKPLKPTLVSSSIEQIFNDAYRKGNEIIIKLNKLSFKKVLRELSF